MAAAHTPPAGLGDTSADPGQRDSVQTAEFDQHSSTYGELHKHNIAMTGEEPAYFADYKMRDFASLVLEAGLPPDGCYLDFGSGVGASVAPFSSHLPAARLVCADVSADSLALSKSIHGAAADYVWSPNGALPLRNAEFDGVFACCVFHHIPHDRHVEVLRDLLRVVKPGGLMMIYEHNPFNPLTVRAVRTCPFDANAVLLSAGQLARACIDAGWREQCRDYRVFFPAALSGLRPLENHLRWLPLGAQYFVAMRA